MTVVIINEVSNYGCSEFAKSVNPNGRTLDQLLNEVKNRKTYSYRDLLDRGYSRVQVPNGYVGEAFIALTQEHYENVDVYVKYLSPKTEDDTIMFYHRGNKDSSNMYMNIALVDSETGEVLRTISDSSESYPEGEMIFFRKRGE